MGAATVQPAPPPPDTPVALAVNAEIEPYINYFRDGGVWSLLVPGEDGEQRSTVLVLAGGDGLDSVKSVTVNATTYVDFALHDAATQVLFLPDADPATQRSFIERFANGIERNELTAHLVTVDAIPDDGIIVPASPVALSAAEFTSTIEKVMIDAVGDAAPAAPAQSTALPTATLPPATVPTETPLALMPTVTPQAVAAGGVALPKIPAVPAIPTVVIPKIPAIPAIPAVVAPKVPTVPPLPGIVQAPLNSAAPASAAPGDIALSASTGITLSGALINQTGVDDATAERITLDLVVANDGTQIVKVILHLTNVKCPKTTMGCLTQTFPHPVNIVEGKFTFPISEQGKIEGDLVAPTSAQGVADVYLSVRMAGFPNIECDLGHWEWAATD